MALLNRFSRLPGGSAGSSETGVFTFIVTKSVTRDLHRDATTKDFCFGHHRWALSFQRPTERTLGVHLLLRNPSPGTSCLVDFTLTILNRRHPSLNEVYTKLQARFSAANPMQGVARWIQISELAGRHFSNETGEFLFELALGNVSTVYECDLQLSSQQVAAYRSRLEAGSGELLSLATNCFTFGAFEWSLAVVPLTLGSQPPEPVCRVYLNRLNGLDCLCRVRYRVRLGGSNQQQHQSGEPRADSKLLDQMSDSVGRIRGHQFRQTNLLELATSRGGGAPTSGSPSSAFQGASPSPGGHRLTSGAGAANAPPTAGPLELRVHIEMFCANSVSECRVPLSRSPGEAQLSNCSDRNKQAWCVECDADQEHLRLKLFFMDLKSIPRNHIRFISWCAYAVRRDPKSGQVRDSAPVRNAPHSNLYAQDGVDLGIIMDTELPAKELAQAGYLCEPNQLLVHIEWLDSLLLFSHLYTSYDALATVQRHQLGRELGALKADLEALERKYGQCRRQLSQLLSQRGRPELDSGHSSTDSPPPPGNQLTSSERRLASRRGTQVSVVEPLPAGSQGADCWPGHELLAKQLGALVSLQQPAARAGSPVHQQQQQHPEMASGSIYLQPTQRLSRRLPLQPPDQLGGRRNSALPLAGNGHLVASEPIMEPAAYFKQRPPSAVGHNEFGASISGAHQQLRPSGAHQFAGAQVEGGTVLAGLDELRYLAASYHTGSAALHHKPQPQPQPQLQQHQQATLQCHRNTYLAATEGGRARHHSLYPISAGPPQLTRSPSPYAAHQRAPPAPPPPAAATSSSLAHLADPNWY